ncbi:cation diffusion facilitator family transporter [Calditerricola satsumensis]|uniref:Cation transporter n=1 Tax=Calditerricola satsumensis TaxID=373054 RepID=A0A8J3BBC7_9BACI|nr:cation diffusion facilitator family transporter [Calditerricola satsumensis]GGK01532.1 cation transporter [Calditerricola satsumensis]
MTTEGRFRLASRMAVLGIGANVLLAVVKGIVGVWAGSRALIADAVNSATDVVGSLAVWIGLRMARQPPDEDHPYGHGKAEPVAAIIVSVLVLVVGIEIARSSVTALFRPMDAPGVAAAIVAAATVVLKEALYRITLRFGRRLNSHALLANALDHRSDALASSAVLLGVGGAIAGERLGLPQLAHLDPVAGLVVALFVLRTAYRMLNEAVHNTIDHVLHAEDAQELVEAVKRVPGVLRVDELLAREHGHYVVVDVKIAVDGRLTVEEGHEIAKAVKARLVEEFAHVRDALVHVNPFPRKCSDFEGERARDDRNTAGDHAANSNVYTTPSISYNESGPIKE